MRPKVLNGKSHWGGNTGGIICSALSSISYVSKGYKTIDLIIDKVGKFEIKSSPDVNYGSSGLLDEDQYGVLHNKIAKEFFMIPMSEKDGIWSLIS